MIENLLNRKVPRGVSWPAAVMIRAEEAAEARGVGFSEFVVDAVIEKLDEAGDELSAGSGSEYVAESVELRLQRSEETTEEGEVEREEA